MKDAATIFQDVPDDIDETWRHGALVGGMVDLVVKERGALASSFKRAGDTLLASALATDAASELLYPLLFSYRHAIELYLKAIVGPKKSNHDLNGLIAQFQDTLRERLDVEAPESFLARLSEFHDVDSRSTTFRYPDLGVVSKAGRFSGEVWVDFPRLKKLMDWLDVVFLRVIAELRALE